MSLELASVTAMIPARLGSERLRRKNLVLVGGEPLIAYAIKAAKKSQVFDHVVVNSEDPIFRHVAEKYGVGFYLRPEKLASSETQSDDVVYDFAVNHPADVIAWVNPIAPLQPAQEIREVVTYFVQEKLDSLITVREDKVHCNFHGQPLNYSLKERFARTQDLRPVQRFVYSLMIWRRDGFVNEYEVHGHAILFGRMGFFPVSQLSSLIVKTEEDIRLCEYVLRGMAHRRKPLSYFAGPAEL